LSCPFDAPIDDPGFLFVARSSNTCSPPQTTEIDLRIALRSSTRRDADATRFQNFFTTRA
jgi:hypothetical protein